MVGCGLIPRGDPVTFEQLEDLFFTLQIRANPSGFHGFLCGRLSCGAVDMQQLVKASSQWLAMTEEQAEGAENQNSQPFSCSRMRRGDRSGRSGRARLRAIPPSTLRRVPEGVPD